MKILLTANLHYFPALGGANKINRRLLEGLAARGHTVEVVVPALGTPSRITHEELLQAFESKGIAVRVEDGRVDRFTLNGVDAHAVVNPAELRPYLGERLERFQPDCVIVTSEDPSQSMLETALRVMPDRVAYMVFTSSFLPFGSQAFFPGERRAKLLTRVKSIGAMSSYLADYIKKEGGFDAEVVHMPIFDRAPFPRLASFDNPFVTLVNPCTIKGLPIFTELARRLPQVRFAAVPLWGTTADDRAQLEALSNVTLLNPVEDVDEIYRQTRVLLMPSLWAETFGMACVEAMLRGIPVLASDIGGLTEAKQGTEGVLPVRPIEGFTSRLDGNMIPVGRCPEQDVQPWMEALERLLSDREIYERASVAAYEGGMRYHHNATDERIESFLLRAIGRQPLPQH